MVDMEATTIVILVLVLSIGLMLGAVIGGLWVRSRAASSAAESVASSLAASVAESERIAIESRATDQTVVREGLDRLHGQVRDLERHQESWRGQLTQQVADVRYSTETLRRETAALSTALRKPAVRGRWGELHLRKAVELAGMVSRCDFGEQVSVRDDDALRRPDLVVHLAGGKSVIVDAKVPLDAVLDAAEADTDAQRDAHLARHARQLRQHVDNLSAKSYWRALPATPEFVVLFVPGESFLSAALEAEPSLIEYAATRQVVLATPTTLIALLRTVAYAWKEKALADRARDIHELGRQLYDRINVLGGYLDKLGRSLSGAVGSYNRAIGSLETRVLVSARKFAEMEVSDEELITPEPVTDAPRPLTSAELIEIVADPRDPLPELREPPTFPEQRRAEGA